MTPAERKALLFLAVVGTLGVGARAFGTTAGGPATTVETRRALLRQIAAVDSARKAGEGGDRKGKKKRGGAVTESGFSAGRKGRRGPRTDVSEPSQATVPPAAGPRPEWLTAPAVREGPRAAEPGAGTIDVDRAGAAELEALPGVGPALAARIVAERRRGGPFGGLEALDARVRGIGPALARRLAGTVTFSGVPRQPSGSPDVPSVRERGGATPRSSARRRSMTAAPSP